MGRSVEIIGENVLYFDASDEYHQEDFAWEGLIDNLQEVLKDTFPSLEYRREFASYPHRESMLILENYHVWVYLSEYCGCGAISIATEKAEYPELANHWLDSVWNRLVKIIGGHVDLLNRIGTFSNGCGVFERAKT